MEDPDGRHPASPESASAAAEDASRPGRRFLVGLVAVGLLWRALVSALTPLPSEDGVNYLWMAEQFARGDAGAALTEVFPPLTSLLIAVPVALGLDPFRAGQLVLGMAGALSLVFLVLGAEQVAPGGGRCAGCFAVFAPLPVRFGAEVYSEPLFVLLTAVAVWLGLRGRLGGLGWAAGAAFWVRPEAAVLVVAFGLARPRDAWRCALPFAVPVLALAAWRGVHGLGFRPVGRLLELVRERSVAGADGAGVQQLVDNALALPWLWVEAFGVLGLLALWGMVRGRGRGRAVLGWTLLLGALVICAFLARRRFLVSWLAAVSPLAILGFRALPRPARTPVFWLVVLSSMALSLRTMAPDRAAERAVGAHLEARLRPGEQVAGDMTRVVYYAGRRPLPPRRFTADELIAAGRPPAVRFVVLGARRADAAAVAAGLQPWFERHRLPPDLAVAAEARGILVLERR